MGTHIPVLFEETVSSLNVRDGGTYVDLTLGRAGHSSKILSLIPHGHLYGFDLDPMALEEGRKRLLEVGENFTLIHDRYETLADRLREYGVDKVDGILADLGVSSHQLDTPERGFSFHTDAPLDMRMSQEGPTAADLCNNLPEAELRKILYTYGEEKNAPRIAASIVRARADAPIETTLQLAELVKEAVPAKARRAKHPARKTFQALRIAVNGEMDVLNTALDSMFDVLKDGGILSIITFHSLEDRMVKQRFASYCQGCICPPEFPVCVCGRTPSAELPFKFKVAGEAELEQNPRSRSAKLRCVKKLKSRDPD